MLAIECHFMTLNSLQSQADCPFLLPSWILLSPCPQLSAVSSAQTGQTFCQWRVCRSEETVNSSNLLHMHVWSTPSATLSCSRLCYKRRLYRDNRPPQARGSRCSDFSCATPMFFARFQHIKTKPRIFKMAILFTMCDC